MFDPVVAATVRANDLRAQLRKAEERLDADRRQLAMARGEQKDAYSAKGRAALADFVELDRLEVLQTLGRLRCYEDVAQGKRGAPR